MLNRDSKMENGATVSDWLGTAMTAAGIAATRIENIRNGIEDETSFQTILEHLDQAREEIAAVQEHAAYSAAFGERAAGA